MLPGEDEAAFRRRVNDITDALALSNAAEVLLAEQAVLASWKIERAERAEAARVAAALRAAEAGADLEKRDEIAAMGHWLLTDTLTARQDAAASLLPFLSEDRHDPFRRGRGDPRHIVLRLEATAGGCEWLLDQWARLRERLERGHDWRTNELIVALQLRGQRPLGLDLAEWKGLLEPIPAGGDPELIARARRRLLSQLEESLPGDPPGQRAALLRLVQEETARLSQRKAGHHQREAADRAELADRLAVDTTPEGERMRRYQLDFDRKLHRALNSLLKLRRGEDVGDPAPDRTPEPEPEPVGTVELPSGPVDGPEGQAGAAFQPRTQGHSLEDEDSVAVGVPSSVGLDPSSILESELITSAVVREAAAPASAGIAAPARAAAEPESHPIPQDEPSPAVVRCPSSVVRCWGGAGISQNEPSPQAHGDETPQNEPTTPAAGDQMPQNEPRAKKLRKGGRISIRKPFVGTLRVRIPPGRAGTSNRKRVLRGGG